jgi:hypothetical protein
MIGRRGALRPIFIECRRGADWGGRMGVQEIAALAGTLGIGSALPSIGKAAWRWIRGYGVRELSRIEVLEQLVDALRRALDKCRSREDALAQVLGVLIFGLKHIEDLNPVIADAIERAIEILERAQNQLGAKPKGEAQ